MKQECASRRAICPGESLATNRRFTDETRSVVRKVELDPTIASAWGQTCHLMAREDVTAGEDVMYGVAEIIALPRA